MSYPQPPGPYPPPRPGGGMSNQAKFWIGVVLALPVVVLGSLISGAASAVVNGVGANPDATAVVALVVGLGEFVALVVAALLEPTRWFAIGVIAGIAVLLILAAGTCVVLIIALTNSYN